MRNFLVITACVAAFVVVMGCSDDQCDPCAPVVLAQPLAQLDVGIGGGGSVGADTLRVLFVSSNDDTLFDMLVTEDDDGTIKTVDADIYPEFTNAAATLTDGTNDSWTFWTLFHPNGGGGGGGNYESTWIDGGLTGEYDPDLQGAEVTEAIIHLDEVYVDNQGGYTNYSVSARVVIMGKP